MAYTFGEYPLHVTHDDGTYTVTPPEVSEAAVFGVTETFGADMLDTMTSRAYAHGFKIIIAEVYDTDEIPVVKPPKPSSSIGG